MITQDVFIISFNSLYEILDEIKENLSFKMIKFENQNDLVKNSDLISPNSLIISKITPNLSLIKGITDKNLLDLKDCPLPFNKLLELINIQLIKLVQSTV